MSGELLGSYPQAFSHLALIRPAVRLPAVDADEGASMEGRRCRLQLAGPASARGDG